MARQHQCLTHANLLQINALSGRSLLEEAPKGKSYPASEEIIKQIRFKGKCNIADKVGVPEGTLTGEMVKFLVEIF